MNDSYQAFKSCQAEVVFYNDQKKAVKSEQIQIEGIAPDSSGVYAELQCKVPGSLGDKFYVEIKLKDQSGEVVSSNKYLLLVADEKVDLPKLREIGKQDGEKKAKYGSTSYLRYYEGLTNTPGVKQADEAIPTVKEFIQD